MRRTLISCISVALIAAVVALAPVRVPAQSAATRGKAGGKSTAQTKSKGVPRMPDGKPDFSGYWSNSTVTPLERPAALGDKAFVDEKEAADLEKNGNRDDSRSRNGRVSSGGSPGGIGVGDYNGLWYELGKTVLANRRTSIVTDPADGRIPPLTPEAQKRLQKDRDYYSAHPADGPESEDSITRCITWITSGPPMLPTFYNNNYQIVQTEDHIAIVAEMIHDARIIPLDGGPQKHPHVPPAIGQWTGDSRGHWEGDTLVVETTNFNGKRNYLGGRAITEGVVTAAADGAEGRGGGGGGAGGRSGAGRSDEKMRVIERFTRTDADTLMYQFTVDDPGTYTRPWSGEIPMKVTQGPLYEYACHEGNYAMMDILSGARAEEKQAASTKK